MVSTGRILFFVVVRKAGIEAVCIDQLLSQTLLLRQATACQRKRPNEETAGIVQQYSDCEVATVSE